MAQTALTNSFKTYESVGNREDLSNVIYNIAPSDTPLLSAIGSTSASSTKHEWQTDTLAAPAVNAQVEGFEAEIEASTPTERVGNYTQIFSKTVAVSNTQETVNKAGRSSEMAYQTAKRMKEMKLDIELALLSNTASAAGSSTVARRLGGFPTWIETNASYGAGGSAGSKGSKKATAGTARNLTEDMLRDVLTTAYKNGANIKQMFVSPAMKSYVSKTFGGTGDAVTSYRQQNSKQAGFAVEVYNSDFGTIDIVPDRVMANEGVDNQVLLIDPQYASVAWLRNVSRKPLAETGDNKKALMTAELTLKVNNEKAHGIIGDVKPGTAA